MPKRFYAIVTILLLLALPAWGAVGDADYHSISDEAYTADLIQAGYHNGDMPSFRMIEVGNCLLERDAAYTLSLMLEAARADGVDLVPHYCYRSFSAQTQAYDRRCPIEEEELTRTDPLTGEEVVTGVRKVRSCSGPPIATPGRSNHGWGRAIDFGNGRRVLSCHDSQYRWLQDNGARFGWVHPAWAECGRATREPWHWEWGGVTDALPLPVPPARSYAASDARPR